jgi:hypothetical protein
VLAAPVELQAHQSTSSVAAYPVGEFGPKCPELLEPSVLVVDGVNRTG